MTIAMLLANTVAAAGGARAADRPSAGLSRRRADDDEVGLARQRSTAACSSAKAGGFESASSKPRDAARARSRSSCASASTGAVRGLGVLAQLREELVAGGPDESRSTTARSTLQTAPGSLSFLWSISTKRQLMIARR